MNTEEAEKHKQALDDAIMRVAEAARELSDNASRLAAHWQVESEDMRELRKALKGWTEAGETFVRAVRESANEAAPAQGGGS